MDFLLTTDYLLCKRMKLNEKKVIKKLDKPYKKCYINRVNKINKGEKNVYK